MPANLHNTIAILVALAAVSMSGCTSPLRHAQSTPSGRFLTPPSSLATPVAEQTIPPTAAAKATGPSSNRAPDIVRNQNTSAADVPATYPNGQNESADGSDRLRYPMALSGQETPSTDSPPLIQRGQYTGQDVQQGMSAWGQYVPTQVAPPPPAETYGAPSAAVGNAGGGYTATPYANAPYVNSPVPPYPNSQVLGAPNAPNGGVLPQYASPLPPGPLTDIIVNVQETQTGRFMLGASVNSDAGVTGQIVIDEKNFDWRKIPTSVDDFINGSAFRGAGQGLRIEALPGDEVQRYMVQFTDPYLFNTRINMSLSAYLYNRRFFDWSEERFGGRMGLGYRLTPDMTISAGLRAEQVTIYNPRVVGVPELDDALGNSDLYSGRIQLIQDTRDIPFAPTQGYYFSASVEQVFGTFDYTRGELDWRRYFLLSERPDGSGRHVLGFSNQFNISGSDTPIYENYFAGGYATLRGFDFRRASPQIDTITVGGRLMLLGSVEYLFPITADDMVKGVTFVDYGTVEQDISIQSENYRVAFGAGLRISIPAMGPAPIALDFAVPVARAETDEIRQFSFFLGVSR